MLNGDYTPSKIKLLSVICYILAGRVNGYAPFLVNGYRLEYTFLICKISM